MEMNRVEYGVRVKNRQKKSGCNPKQNSRVLLLFEYQTGKIANSGPMQSMANRQGR